MDKIKIIVAGLVVAIVAAVGVMAVRPAAPVTAPGFGALAGPDIPSQYLKWGDVTYFNYGPAISATSSVFCSVQITATSSLEGIGVRFDGNSLGASQTFDVSTSSTAVGSSSPAFIKAASVGTGPTASAPTAFAWQPGTVATTSPYTGLAGPISGATPYVVNTNEFVNWRIATGTPLANTGQLSGQCTLRTVKL